MGSVSHLLLSLYLWDTPQALLLPGTFPTIGVAKES